MARIVKVLRSSREIQMVVIAAIMESFARVNPETPSRMMYPICIG
jgi:hypothetical protein